MKNTYGRPEFHARYAFPTLGSAGFQTVVGAFSTGTHGGDFDRGPVSDCIVAIHLVVDGGDHYWLEPTPTHDWPAMTDDAVLHARYDRADPNVKFHIVRNDQLFDAVLVSAGRFGVIYSVVVKAQRQYMLHEQRRLTTWSAVKDKIKNRRSDLYNHDGDYSHFLQIVVNLSPCAFFSENQAGVTKRWPVQYFGDQLPVAGRDERVGTKYPDFNFNKQIQSPYYTRAGNQNAYSDGGTGFLEIACSEKSFLNGSLTAIVDQIDDFVASNGTTIGATIAAVGYAVGPAAVFGLLALLPALAIIVEVLRAALSLIDDNTRFGEFVNGMKNTLLNAPPHGVTRPAGVFVWQLISYELFKTQQGDNDIEGVSYSILDNHDYMAYACDVNVASMEVFFDSRSDELIAFIDQLLSFEVRQQYQGKATLGYAAIRFTGPTRATLGEQFYKTTAVVEVSALKDVTGGEDMVSFACSIARSEMFGGILHWGQQNDCTQAEIEARFGDAVGVSNRGRLGSWRDSLAYFTDNGRLNGFSNAFSRQTGLEVVQPRMGSFEMEWSGKNVLLRWDCRNNPPATRASLVVRYRSLFGIPVGDLLGDNLALQGSYLYAPPQSGLFEFDFGLALTTNDTRYARGLLQVEVEQQ